jgi:aldose 1-epimerase
MKKTLSLFTCSAVLLIAAGCSHTYNSPSLSQDAGEILISNHGKLADGTPVKLYTLRNSRGMEARISAYGGTVTHLFAPDRAGNMGDVVLGYDRLRGYLISSPYFGCLVGRYGNRIANGRFSLDGKTYQLATNNGPNTLHGGLKGFDKVLWKAIPTVTTNGPALELTYESVDGEEGYPGTLTVRATYTLTRQNELRLDYSAKTDKPTVVNLTQHSYFNLAGKGEILDHELMIPADKFTPVNERLIPTGELRSLDGSPFDFRKPTAIGARIHQKDKQLEYGKGYDHNYVVNKAAGELTLAARVHEPTSGRVLEIWSTEPGVQFYSGNFLDGTIYGKGMQNYKLHNGFCLEPQHYPDSPNQPSFPSTVLRPGEEYKNTIIHRLSTQ